MQRRLPVFSVKYTKCIKYSIKDMVDRVLFNKCYFYFVIMINLTKYCWNILLILSHCCRKYCWYFLKIVYARFLALTIALFHDHYVSWKFSSSKFSNPQPFEYFPSMDIKWDTGGIHQQLAYNSVYYKGH